MTGKRIGGRLQPFSEIAVLKQHAFVRLIQLSGRDAEVFDAVAFFGERNFIVERLPLIGEDDVRDEIVHPFPESVSKYCQAVA